MGGGGGRELWVAVVQLCGERCVGKLCVGNCLGAVRGELCGGFVGGRCACVGAVGGTVCGKCEGGAVWGLWPGIVGDVWGGVGELCGGTVVGSCVRELCEGAVFH